MFCFDSEGNGKELDALEFGGNDRVNAIFESHNVFESLKPNHSSTSQLRTIFIKKKYQSRQFYDSTAYKETLEKRKYPSDAKNLKPVTPNVIRPIIRLNDSFSPFGDTFEDDDNFEDGNDMFDDSATTTSDLFGHCTKSPKKKTHALRPIPMKIEEEKEYSDEKTMACEDDEFAQLATDRSRDTLNFEMEEECDNNSFDLNSFDQLLKGRNIHQTPVRIPIIVEALEVAKIKAVTEEDYLKAAELKKQIDELISVCGQKQRQRPAYTNRNEWRNPMDNTSKHDKSVGTTHAVVGTTSTKKSKGGHDALHSFFSKTDKVAKTEITSREALLDRQRSRKSLGYTVESAPEPSEVDDFGFISKGKSGIKQTGSYPRDGFHTPSSSKPKPSVDSVTLELKECLAADIGSANVSPASTKSDGVLAQRRRSRSRPRSSSQHTRRSTSSSRSRRRESRGHGDIRDSSLSSLHSRCSRNSRRAERRLSGAHAGGDANDNIHYRDPSPASLHSRCSSKSRRAERHLSDAHANDNVDNNIHDGELPLSSNHARRSSKSRRAERRGAHADDNVDNNIHDGDLPLSPNHARRFSKSRRAERRISGAHGGGDVNDSIQYEDLAPSSKHSRRLTRRSVSQSNIEHLSCSHQRPCKSSDHIDSSAEMHHLSPFTHRLSTDRRILPSPPPAPLVETSPTAVAETVLSEGSSHRRSSRKVRVRRRRAPSIETG